MRHREGLLLRAQNEAKSEKFLRNIMEDSRFYRRGRGGLSTQHSTEEKIMPNQGGTREQHAKAGEKSRKGSSGKEAAGKPAEKNMSSGGDTKGAAKSSDTRKSH